MREILKMEESSLENAGLPPTYKHSKKSIYGSCISHIETLQRRVPIVGDKAIIDLVNGIYISKDIIRYRKNRGWFGQLFDKLDGSENKRRVLLDGNLIAGQEALYKWVLELSDSLRISQVALTVT